MLSDPKRNGEIYLKCFGKVERDTDLEFAAQYIDEVAEAAGQNVCPIALIGYDIPADVFIGENGLLYCLFEFQEEIGVFETPAQILEFYLKNNEPIGVDQRPIRKTYDGLVL